MEELSLNGKLTSDTRLELILKHSKKDAIGRRKSFRITQKMIDEAVQGKRNNKN